MIIRNNNQSADEIFNITNIAGANGTRGRDTGYSAAAGDIDNDGLSDPIVNEVVGNGVSVDTVDAGNLIIISGTVVTQLK